MRVQVLVAAVGQTDHKLLSKMNIQSDVIVANQCGQNSVEHFTYNNHRAMYLNFQEKGVGLNRNNALMRADGDICLFADDDMVYCDNYVEVVVDAFSCHPEADILVFNLVERVPSRYVIKKFMTVHYLNYLRYGTARVAIRLKSVRQAGIYFNQCFGGGTEYCHGEDNLFLTECLKKGLKIFAVPEYIAQLTEERPSSWNNGYDETYLHDQGILYRAISRRWWMALCLQDVVRHKKNYQLVGNWWEALRIMYSGAKEFGNREGG